MLCLYCIMSTGIMSGRRHGDHHRFAVRNLSSKALICLVQLASHALVMQFARSLLDYCRPPRRLRLCRCRLDSSVAPKAFGGHCNVLSRPTLDALIPSNLLKHVANTVEV